MGLPQQQSPAPGIPSFQRWPSSRPRAGPADARGDDRGCAAQTAKVSPATSDRFTRRQRDARGRVRIDRHRREQGALHLPHPTWPLGPRCTFQASGAERLRKDKPTVNRAVPNPHLAAIHEQCAGAAGAIWIKWMPRTQHQTGYQPCQIAPPRHALAGPQLSQALTDPRPQVLGRSIICRPKGGPSISSALGGKMPSRSRSVVSAWLPAPRLMDSTAAFVPAFYPLTKHI